MTNIFLKINKDLFKLGLNPTEILILAQIIEFNTNTGDCFISDKQLAETFGVSESTVKREVKKLEELGFIIRETKNVKGGKERHIKVNLTKIEEVLTSVKMSFDNANKAQNELSTSVNLPLVKEQNDTIKENIKDNLKDNYMGELKPLPGVFNSPKSEPGEEKLGSLENPIKVNRDWLVDRYNSLTVLANGLYMYGSLFYKLEE